MNKNNKDVFTKILNTGFDTYMNYQDYKKNPDFFKEKKEGLYNIFQIFDNTVFNIKEHLKNSSKNKNNSSYYSNFNDYYSILESSEKDSNEVIKNNYKRLVKEYHPDTIKGKDLPKGFEEFANKKFQQIHNAYQELKKIRNFN